MAKKLKLPKKIKRFTLTQLGMEGYPDDFYIEVWDDPSKPHVISIIEMVFASKKDVLGGEGDELYRRFKESISAVFIDTNIEGLEFGTPDDIDESMNSEDLPWGFFMEIVWRYITMMLETSNKLKKLFGLPNEILSFGQTDEKREQKSPRKSGKE
jgi:hypothetical protein